MSDFFSSELSAFIYDATVLEYLVAQDEECKLLTVGSWHAMTGYGAAFPRNSKHFNNFNTKIMEYSEMGKTLRIQMIDLFIYPENVKLAIFID